MSDGRKGIIEYHPGACPTHYSPDTLFHLWPIAVDGAFLACRLLSAVTASVKSAAGIVRQLSPSRTQLDVSFVLPTIQPYHLFHNRLLFLYASVGHSITHLYQTLFQAFLCRFLCGRCSCEQHVWHEGIRCPHTD